MPTAILLFNLIAALPSVAVQPADGKTSPPESTFKMLVLGDSVVWGQGLEPEEKFSYLIQDKIKTQLGRQVEIQNLSHSGATIKPRYETSISAHGEVPLPSPTIWNQFRSSISKYSCVERSGDQPEDPWKRKYRCETVNLVLLNGCINDVGLEVILNPFESEKKIKKRSRKYCFEEMKALLEEIAATFVNATIVVTGYYPIISRNESGTGTPPTLVSDLIKGFLTRKEVLSIKRSFAWPSSRIVKRLAKLSSAWRAASDQDLGESVASLNRPEGRRRVLFVDVKFEPSESYGAANTKLWKIDKFSPTRVALTNDRMRDARIGTHCQPAREMLDRIEMKGWLRSLLKLICKPAGAGHPNVEGALKYRDAIWKKLQPTFQP